MRNYGIITTIMVIIFTLGISGEAWADACSDADASFNAGWITQADRDAICNGPVAKKTTTKKKKRQVAAKKETVAGLGTGHYIWLGGLSLLGILGLIAFILVFSRASKKREDENKAEIEALRKAVREFSSKLIDLGVYTEFSDTAAVREARLKLERKLAAINDGIPNYDGIPNDPDVDPDTDDGDDDDDKDDDE